MLRCTKYISQFSQLLRHFPVQTQWKTVLDKTTNLAGVIRSSRYKDMLAHFSQAASVVSRESIRFHLIQGKQSINLLPQLTALQNNKFSVDEWQAHLSAPNAVLIAAFNSKEPIGFILAHQEVSLEDIYVIDDLAFVPEYQNRGIGSCLAKAAGWLAFELNLTQLIGFIDGKEALPPNVQEFLRGVGAEEISSGIDGGHYLRLDLTASCVVPMHMNHGILLGRTTGRAGAWIDEAFDPSWHRRVKTFKVPADIKEEKGSLGEDAMVQSGRANSPKTLVELLKGIDWKDVLPILPHEKTEPLAAMRKHPATAANFNQTFCARPEIIPFIKETYLFRYILENFGQLQVKAEGNEFVLFSGDEIIGKIKAEPKDGIFVVSYHGKTHPEGRTGRMVAMGQKRIDQSLIDLADLYYLLNICHHYQHLEGRFKEQVPKLTQIFYIALRGSNTPKALLVILFTLNHMGESAYINNFINALAEASEADWSFFAFWVLVEKIISKKPDWERVNLACEYILKINDFNGPLYQQIVAWSKAEGVFELQDEIYKKAFGPINIAIIQMVEAGASAEDLDRLFAAAITAERATPAFNLFFVAATLFEKAGSTLFQELIDCLRQSPIFEKYSRDVNTHNFRHLLADAAVNLLFENEKEAIGILFDVCGVDKELGTQIAQIVARNIEGARFIAALSSEMKLVKDRRIREKLTQVIWAASPLLQSGKAVQLVESVNGQGADNVYNRLDRIFDLLQFSQTEEEAQAFITGGIEGLKEKLFRKIEQRFGFEADLASWPIYTPEGFVRSANQLLHDKQRPDPNIAFLLGKVAEHGSIHQFYRVDERAQQTIAALISEGYDVEHFVFGQPSLMQAQGRSGSIDDLYSIWLEIAQVVKLLFDEIFSTAFFSAIEPIKDPDQAKTLTFKYLKLLREKASEISRTSRKTSRRKEELIDLLNGVEWQVQHGVYVEGGRIESHKSTKAVPEMLFDNRRLACCVFFPNGEVRDEIPLVAMDPQTPMVEFWVSELDEFAGAAIEYAGKNRELLLDTFEFSQGLTAVLGGDPTFRFVTDSLVLDAYRGGARRLLVYDCDYGHPLRYVRYLRNIVKKEAYQGIVSFESKYHFELADLQSHALRNSKSGVSMHYTDAFRTKNYRRGQMRGNIPVFVIDVEAYYERFKERIEAGIAT